MRPASAKSRSKTSKPSGIRGRPTIDARLAHLPQHRQPRVLVRDVQQDDAVHHPGAQDPLHRVRAVGLGHHQDVVARLARGIGDRQDVLQHRGRELVLEELDEQADDHRLRRGQGPRSRRAG